MHDGWEDKILKTSQLLVGETGQFQERSQVWLLEVVRWSVS